MERSTTSPTVSEGRPGPPGLLGITLAVVFLGFASDRLESLLGPGFGELFDGARTLEPQWAMLVHRHLLAWWSWVPAVVFGLAAMLIFRCNLREVFLLPAPSDWSARKSAGVSLVIALLMSALIFAGAWNQVDPAFHWGLMAGNLFSNFYEELFFRGFLLGMLLRFSRRRWWAIVVTAAYFTLAHGQYHGWESFGFFLLALPFGWLTWKSGWILWPYLVHMLVDWIVDPWVVPGYAWNYLPG